MRKRSATSLPESGFASLAAEGIDSVSLNAGSVPAERLGEILAAGTEASLALAHLLGEVPRAEHGALLARANEAAHGPLRREVRRALYRLEQAGIVPPLEASSEPIAVGPLTAPLQPEGWLSHVDGAGNQLVWITKPDPGGLLFISARINDIEGLGEINAVEISKRQFRAQRRELSDRHGLRMVPVDWRHADALLAAAHARSAPKSGPGYTQLRARLSTDPTRPLEPPIYRHIPRHTVSADLVQQSADLLDAPELGSWLPAPSVLEPYAREILEARESPLVLSQHQQNDRIGGILDRATRDLYPSELFAPRLEVMAFYFWETGRERHARIALAAAQALASGTPANAVPILGVLLRQSLAAVYQSAQASQQEQEKDSLIVKPTAPSQKRGTRR